MTRSPRQEAADHYGAVIVRVIVVSVMVQNNNVGLPHK
jgi:hypothetical protein